MPRRSPVPTVIALPWFLLAPEHVAAAEATAKTPEPPSSVYELPDGDRPQDLALAAHEPLYFAVGGDGDVATAKFQFSFSYRIFDYDSEFVQEMPLLGRLYFAYTQTSVWDLDETSRPFRDSSYRPSLFLQFETPNDGRLPDLWRGGYEHESNGQGLDVSRSVDMLFIQPGWYFSVDDRLLLVAPKFRVNIETSPLNRDISEYRGYVDLYLRYGREESWITTLTARYGEAGHGSLQLEASYPLRKPIFARTGGYFYVQIFHGYGETLLNYNEHSGTQFRIGLAIVR